MSIFRCIHKTTTKGRCQLCHVSNVEELSSYGTYFHKISQKGSLL